MLTNWPEQKCHGDVCLESLQVIDDPSFISSSMQHQYENSKFTSRIPTKNLLSSLVILRFSQSSSEILKDPQST